LIETSTDLNIIENIACIYIDGNEISKAKKVVEHILNINPQNEFAISLMSICNKFSENKEEARAQYVKLINIKKNEPYT
jgi:Tfp pilus assembly protein PilF